MDKATEKALLAREEEIGERWIVARSRALRSGKKLPLQLVFGDRRNGGSRTHGYEDPNSPASTIERYGN